MNSLARNIAQFTMSGDSIEKREYKANFIHLSFLWVGFVSGAIIGSLIISSLEIWSIAIPVLLLLIYASWLQFQSLKN